MTAKEQRTKKQKWLRTINTIIAVIGFVPMLLILLLFFLVLMRLVADLAITLSGTQPYPPPLPFMATTHLVNTDVGGLASFYRGYAYQTFNVTKNPSALDPDLWFQGPIDDPYLQEIVLFPLKKRAENSFPFEELLSSDKAYFYFESTKWSEEFQYADVWVYDAASNKLYHALWGAEDK